MIQENDESDHEEEYCQLCSWNESYLLFDDCEYSNPRIGTELYLIKLLNGYNWVINPNCFNKIFVCYECLLERIYMCNSEKKHTVLTELKVNTLLRLITERHGLPMEMFRLIYTYLY